MKELIEVRLLGPAMVRTAEGDHVRADQWKTAKNRDLLRLLAVNHGVAVPVDQVVEALWPHTATEKGRASLRTAMAHVRRLLGADAVERVGEGLRLGPAWVDLAVYEARAAAAHRCFADGDTVTGLVAAKEAVALRVGELLAEDPFAEWATVARAHVERVHARLLAAAAEAALDADLVHAALEFASLALRHDACAERPARVAMRACARHGDTAAALRVYSDLRRALVEELGADPAPETSALHLEVLDGQAGGSVAVSSPGTATTTGSPPDCRAQADHLVARLSAAIEERRGHVAVVAGTDVAAVSAALAAASEALRSATTVFELPPHGGTAAIPADVGTGVVVVDGLELPGGDELAALAARAVTSPPAVVLLGCLQPASVLSGPDLASISPDVTLVRLDQDRPPATATTAPAAGAVDAEVLLVARVERARAALTAEEQELVDLLGLAGAPLPVDALLRLGRDLPSTEAALRGLAKLDGLGLLRSTGEGYRLAAGVGELAAAWIRPDRRLALHARLAADERLPTPLRARHLLAAGDPEPAAGLFLAAAVDEARRGPSSGLQRLLWDARQAVTQAGLPDVETVGWLRRIADVAALVGRIDDAVDALAAAVRLQRDGDDDATASLLPAARPRRRRPATGAAEGTDGGVGEPREVAERIRLRCRLLVERAWPARDLEAVRALDDELEELLAGPVDEPTAAAAHLARVEGAVWAGDGAAHLRRLLRAWPVLRSHPDPATAARAGTVLGWALHEVDDARFDDVWDEAGRLAAAAGRQRQWEALSVLITTERGDVAAAREHAAVALASEGAARLDVPITLLGIARHQQRDGRRANAASTLGTALVAARKARQLLLVPEIAARLALLEAALAPASAASHLALAESVAGEGRWFARERGWILAAQSVLCQGAGDHDRAEELWARAEDAFGSARLVWELSAMADAAPGHGSGGPLPDRRRERAAAELGAR